MTEKTTEICIRVSQNEKKKLQKNAKKSVLSLSSYLRKTGLKEEIYSIPDKDFYKIYVEISNLKNEIFSMTTLKINERLEEIQKDFLNIYNSKKVGGYNGNN
ncbi:MAG: hypothetical protein IKM97_00250 [Clostridia bacterium]|nr:hypothetical protein [Clostridia bacterium]